MNPVILFVEKLTILDYAYLDLQQGFLGGTVHVDANIIGDMDSEGVVFDFSKCKKLIKGVIDETMDHKLVIPKQYCEAHDDLFYTTAVPGCSVYSTPGQGLCLIDGSMVNLAAMTAYLQTKIMTAIEEANMLNIDAVEIRLYEEEIKGYWYRYTHGLKSHYGNCQRLIHGHRSQLKIWVDGIRQPDIEKYLCETHHNSHFYFNQNVINETSGEVELAYESSQGKFKACISKEAATAMANETTVENIAIYFCGLVEEMYKNSGIHTFTVQAFEGIEKGAIYSKRS
jgi:6-pyruvoyl-tetrahydropterin synthase